MPKNSGKKGSKKGGTRKSSSIRLREESDGEFYAEVLKPLGCAQMRVQILNGSEATAKLKGSMQKGRGFEKVVPTNWVLLQIDPCTTTTEKYYIIHKYSDSEKKQLEKLGELKSIVERQEVSTFIFEGEDEQEKAKEQEVDDSFIDDI
jgi:translation initiation factor IF-1